MLPSVAASNVGKRLVATNVKPPNASLSNRTGRRISEPENTRRIEYQPLPADPVAIEAIRRGDLGPAEVFAASVARGSATVATAELCLTKFLSDLDTLPPAERLPIMRSKQFAGTVLHWLWGRAKVQDARDFSHMKTAMLVLCDLIVEERNEQYVWDWQAVMTEISMDIAL
jgi:hypothetical protein